MMNRSAFDDHIKNQFDQFEPEVPSQIWENIHARKQRRRPVAIWWNLFNEKKVLTVLITIVSIIGVTVIYNKSNQKNVHHSTAIEENNEKQSIRIQRTDNETSNPTDNVQANNGDNTIEKSDQATVQNKTDAIVTQDDAFNSFSKKGKKDISLPKNVSKEFSEDYTAINKKQKKRKDKGIMLTNIIQPDSYDEVQIENELIKSLPKSVVSLNRKDGEYDKITFDKKFSFNIINKKFNLDPIPCLEKNAAGNKKYVEIYGGPDYAFRNFADTANSQYLQKRKESTTITSAFSAGFRYTKVFNNAMSFSTGLNYSQVNERFRFVQGNIVQVTYIINANGDTTGSFSTTGTRYKTSHNRYKTVDVPLLIGYEMGNGRIHTNIRAGLIMNVYSWQKADILDASLNPVSITTGKSDPSPYQFKNNIGLGFMGAASVYYKMNEHVHLMAEPFVRYNLSSANKADITLKQKFTTIGLRLGIRIDL